MSVAKQFTNVLALSLVERGLLKLHAPVAELIPAFATLGKEKVNLFHLLTHTSGIMSAIPPVPVEVLTNISKLLEFACGLPLESQPGERVNYSILLGHSIIAALCLAADGRGRSYTQMLRDEMFQPLGMHDTNLGPREDLTARLCPVRVSYKDIPALLPKEAVEGLGSILAMPGCELPGGGCLTTIADLHRFAEMLRRGGELDGARLLSPAMLDFCTRNHTGDKRNILFDMWTGTRNWLALPRQHRRRLLHARRGQSSGLVQRYELTAHIRRFWRRLDRLHDRSGARPYAVLLVYGFDGRQLSFRTHRCAGEPGPGGDHQVGRGSHGSFGGPHLRSTRGPANWRGAWHDAMCACHPSVPSE